MTVTGSAGFFLALLLAGKTVYSTVAPSFAIFACVGDLYLVASLCVSEV